MRRASYTQPKLSSVETKACSQCGQSKPAGAFAGKRAACRECVAAYNARYREANRGELMEKARQRRERNRDQNRESSRRHYENNREGRLRHQREYRERQDPTKAAEYFRQYQQTNAERIAAYQRAWYRKNAARIKAIATVRRGRQGRYISVDPETTTYVQVLRRDPCSYCGGDAATVDHIVPVAADGDYDWSNLTAACRSCNSAKRASGLLAFLTRRTEDVCIQCP